jgi:hypothetical protein
MHSNWITWTPSVRFGISSSHVLKARLFGLEKLLRPLLDGRKAHGRDGRTAQRPDGPARASSPRSVIRGESPPGDRLVANSG